MLAITLLGFTVPGHILLIAAVIVVVVVGVIWYATSRQRR